MFHTHLIQFLVAGQGGWLVPIVPSMRLVEAVVLLLAGGPPASAWHHHHHHRAGRRPTTSLGATARRGLRRSPSPAAAPSVSYIHRGKVTDTDPMQLLDYVCTTFPDVKRTVAKQWLKYSSIVVNDEPQARHDFDLRVGDWVAVRGKAAAGGGGNGGGSGGSRGGGGGGGGSLTAAGLRMLHADDALFVVDKPAGMPLAAAAAAAATAPLDAKKDVGGRASKAAAAAVAPRSAHSFVAAHVKRRHGEAAKVRVC